MTTHSKLKAKLLTGVGTSVLASLIAGGSFAAETTVPDFATAVATGHKALLSSVSNNAVIGALATGQTSGITVTGTQTGTSNSVTENTVEAAATANSFANLIDLSLIADSPADGVASLGIAQNSGVVNSTASSNALQIDLTGFASGTAVNDGNAIRATTNVNTGSSTISGTVPNGYVSTTPGSSTFSTAPGIGEDLVAAEGSIVATSVQTNVATGNTASANGNAITLDLSSDTANSVDSSPSVSTNTIASSITANNATTSIGIEAREAPAFTGSAVASNLQSNAGSATATTTSAEISAEIAGTNPAVAVNELDGGLVLASNTISASATGNRAVGANGASGIALTIGDQMSVTGATVSPVSGANFAYDAGDLDGSATADLVVLNSQGNQGDADVGAVVAGAGVGGFVQSIDAGTVSVASNTIAAQATGNTATAALTSGEDAAAFTASVAMASQQTNTGSDVSASTTLTQIAAVTGGTDGGTIDSTVSTTGNTVGATAYGNSVSQSVALKANTLNDGGALTSLTGGTTGATNDGNVSATGLVTVSNLQSNYSSDVTAFNAGSEIGIDADTRGLAGDVVSGSTLSATGNRQEAVALGNSAGNELSLTGNTVGSGAGVANVQIGGNGADVAAGLAAARAGVVVGTHVADSSIEVSGTVQRAIAYGASASNGLAVDGNTVSAAAGGTGSLLAIDATDVPFHGVSQPSVSSAFGVLNDQSILGSVMASVDAVEVGVTVEGDLASSSSTNTGNGIVGAAYGTDAANTLSIDAGSLITAAPGSVAQLTSTQAVAGAASEIDASAYARVTTDIEDDVLASTVTTSENQIQTVSTGNRVTNGMTVTANALETVTSPSITTDALAGLANNNAFGVTNAQSAAGAFNASLLDDDTVPTDSARVLTRLGTDVATITGSTVASNSNQLSAAATANSAANSIAAEGNSISTSMGVQNYQQSSAALQASIGVAGLPSDPGGPFDYTITAVAGTTFDGTEEELVAGTLQIDASALSAHEVAYLVADGWNNVGGGILERDAAGWSATAVEYASLLGAGIDYNAALPASNGTPNIGGVSIYAEGASVVGSTLSVNDNRISGSVTGNSASNALSINAGAIAAGSGLEDATVQSAMSGSTSLVSADYSLSNAQVVTAPGSLDSEVFGTFSVETAEDAAISGSSLSVSGNSQRSVSVANTAANALSNAVSLSANSVDAGSALSSMQSSAAGVSASSAVDILAPAAVTGSTVDMSNNANTALAIMNDVANSSTVSATTISTIGTGAPGEVREAALIAGSGTVTARGDHVLQNVQSAGAVAVSSNASSYIYNLDELATTTTGIAASSVTLMGNATYGEASSNRATNSLTVNGASVQGASAGLGNFQSSAAAVTSNAASVVSVALSGDDTLPAPASTGSTVAVDGNSTTALARGNYASNALNAVAGSSFGTSTVGGRVDVGGSFGAGSVVSDATAAVLNVQGNSGAISAASVGTSYSVALNTATSAAPGAIGSSLSVAGNSVGVEALGNSASNVLRVSDLNTGSPTASLGNSQINSGNISASAVGASIGITGYGLASSSSLGVSANTVSARAVGNSVSSAITRVSR